MTDQQSYNGWTNYATWRVNLEIFDGATAEDIGITGDMDDYTAAQCAKDYIQSFIESHDVDVILSGWIRAFLSDVDWVKIANHIRED